MLPRESMDLPQLEPDCAQCAALCCVAYFFDQGEGFGEDKPAETPCRHLASGKRCAIHSDRVGKGYAGCVAYSCHGAGQRVTRDLFGGRTWHDDPDLLAPMSEVFRSLVRVHEDLTLLRAAISLALSAPQEARRAVLTDRLAALPPVDAVDYEKGPERRAVRDFLSALGPDVAARRQAASRRVAQ